MSKDNTYVTEDDVKHYLEESKDLTLADIPESYLKKAEEMIDEHCTFVDAEGWPVHIAEKDFKAKP